SGPASSDPNPVTFGKHAATAQFFQGTVDDVRIYNRALSLAEIQTDMSTPVGGAPPPDTTPPSAPSNLTATAVSSTQINLSWTAATDNVGVTGYQLERCQGASCSTFALIASPTTTTFSDTGATAGTSYSYRVRAQDAATNLGPYSNIASATTPTADPSVVGQWTAPFTTPIKVVHVASLFTGQVLMWDAFDAGQQAYLWDPASGNFTFVPSPNNVFCSAQTVLPDGRVIAFGGHSGVSFDGT